MATMILTTAVFGAVFGTAGAASAAEAPSSAGAGTVATKGFMLNVRTTPSTAAKPVATLRDGTRIRIVCQRPGQRIDGYVRSTALWDKLPNGRYVSDAYIQRSSAKLPRCTPSGPATRVPEGSWVSPADGRLVSGYRTKGRPTHDGVDIAAARNAPIRAVAAGEVVVATCNISRGHSCDVDGSIKVRGCGWYVDIRHRDGVLTRYCHMVKRPAVRVGQVVKPGDVIGRVGSSGNSSGPHLHFEVRVWKDGRYEPVHPVPFMKSKGVKLA